jgi:CxxC-x17-CxxC domain-containing protein
MHKATCASCGEACEVPFRPSGDKPVYCSACFRNTQDGGDRAPRKDFGRPSFVKSPDYRNTGGGDNKREFEAINAKLDKLTVSINRLVDIMAENKTDSKTEKESVPVTKKVAVKKAAVKKPKKS